MAVIVEIRKGGKVTHSIINPRRASGYVPDAKPRTRVLETVTTADFATLFDGRILTPVEKPKRTMHDTRLPHWRY